MKIYRRGSRAYWRAMDAAMRAFAGREGLEYAVNDDTLRRPFDAPPVIVNYFYHEEIKKRRGAAKTEGKGE